MVNRSADTGRYWCKVLMRIVSTVKFIAERGLAFRGADEVVGSPNNGNYLGILELLAEYDTFLSALSNYMRISEVVTKITSL